MIICCTDLQIPTVTALNCKQVPVSSKPGMSVRNTQSAHLSKFHLPVKCNYTMDEAWGDAVPPFLFNDNLF